MAEPRKNEWRGVLSKADIRSILHTCRQNGIRLIPLV